jgi:hypothetical protein
LRETAWGNAQANNNIGSISWLHLPRHLISHQELASEKAFKLLDGCFDDDDKELEELKFFSIYPFLFNQRISRSISVIFPMFFPSCFR